jgi:hypothetical protein
MSLKRCFGVWSRGRSFLKELLPFDAVKDERNERSVRQSVGESKGSFINRANMKECI